MRIQYIAAVVVVSVAFATNCDSVVAQEIGDAISRFDPDTQSVSGNWQVNDGELSIAPDQSARAVLFQKVPRSYSLTVEFTRVSGTNAIGLILPVGSSQCAFLMSVFDGEAHGIGTIGGQLARSNATTIRPGTLENEHTYRLLVEVAVQDDTAEIGSTLDGRPFLNWKGDPASLGMLDFWRLKSEANLGLCVYADTTFHRIELGRLSPTMRMTAPVKSSNATDDTTNLPSVLYPLSHGEADVGGFQSVANKVGMRIQTTREPVETVALKDHRCVYLRVPKTAISDAEVDALENFVRKGGSLLVVMDEERRTSLKDSRVNTLLKRLGLELTADLPYVHNCGATTIASDVVDADLEIPYSGGRAVSGGEPFAFRLDDDGARAEPVAAALTIGDGGRVVVLAEGMAAGLMGTPTGERLTGVPRNPARTTYWGKDSSGFMTGVIRWLSATRE